LFRQDGKLLQFVKDLHSEKLHQDFHNPHAATKQTIQNVIQQLSTFL
jgi:hypothetical protein